MLKDFLTSIGISLEEARQLYKYLSRESRARLKNDMYDKMDKLNMPDLIFPSFARKIDTNLTLTSSDMSCVITAILEAPEKDNATPKEVLSKRHQNFLDAYELLFNVSSSTAKVLASIEMYKNFMRVLTTEAIRVVDHDVVRCLSYNYVKIKNDSKEKQVFEHPYSLIRLGGTILCFDQVLTQAISGEEEEKYCQAVSNQHRKPNVGPVHRCWDLPGLPQPLRSKVHRNRRKAQTAVQARHLSSKHHRAQEGRSHQADQQPHAARVSLISISMALLFIHNHAVVGSRFSLAGKLEDKHRQPNSRSHQSRLCNCLFCRTAPNSFGVGFRLLFLLFGFGRLGTHEVKLTV